MPGNAADKTQCYEQLRARVLEQHRVPIAMASAVVIVRQGMSVWMLLDTNRKFESHARSGDAQHRANLPAARHSELLSVLTSLVFNVSKQKESA